MAGSTITKEEPLETPSEFPFPFDTPYDVQVDFMKSLFRCLEDGKLGIFESPTGTGKSLSLICGSLLWLKLREEARLRYLEAELAKEESQEESEDWFASAMENLKVKEEKMKLKCELKFIKEKTERIKGVVTRINAERNKEATSFSESYKEEESAENGEDPLLEDYCSDDDEDLEVETLEEEDHSLRIYYSSRTHSQLGQFVKEVQKSPYSKRVRLISLASRNNTCLNDSVRKLKVNHLVNEKCLDLQRQGSRKTASDEDRRTLKKKKTTGGCSFYNVPRLNTFGSRALSEIQDIEQLVSHGRKVKTCPYYGTRRVVKDAELIVVPYNTLLHKSTRKACNIQLKNSVVIIDEAHNLLETLSHIHSSEITGTHLAGAKRQLQGYLERFRTRLKAKNLLYIKQLIFIISSMLKYLTSFTNSSKMISAIDFLHETEIFCVDFFKLLRYITKSKIGYKLRSFADKCTEETIVQISPINKSSNLSFLKSISKQSERIEEPSPNQKAETSDNSRSFNLFAQFLENLIQDNVEGKILIKKTDLLSKSTIKFLLLNPSNHFRDLVNECRSIIVAGGTMEPVEEFKKRLFISSGGNEERIYHFSCGHVVPDENLLPIILHKGPSGKTLDFSFASQTLKETLEELFRLLSNLVNIVPGGLVVFFPSYDYENKVYQFLSDKESWKKIESRKKLFREPKRSDQVGETLSNYARVVKSFGGAMLFSVVGGKMSEGINFSDDLGRCVLMIGLPFPNAESPELKEKMKYLNETEGPSAGKIFYENSCMKAVNQSIGRAVRHSQDYATIVLADHRYSRRNIRRLLPSWVEKKVWVTESFGPSVPKIRNFFKSK